MLRLLKLLPLFLAVLLLVGCGAATVETGGIAATTAPMAQFAGIVAEGTGLAVHQIINDSGSESGQCAAIPADLFMDAWEDSDHFMVTAFEA